MARIVAGEVYPGISIDPAIVHGKPVITGIRVPVTVVLHQLAGGETIESVSENYDVTPEHVRARLATLKSYNAASRITREEVSVIVHA